MNESVEAFVSRYRALGLDGTPATPEEIAALERQFGVVFPAAYKAFLLILGRDGGADFIGSDCTIRSVPTLREGAEKLLRSRGCRFGLPEKAVVFLMHQGYFFIYFVADGTAEDPPIYAYREGDEVPSQKA